MNSRITKFLLAFLLFFLIPICVLPLFAGERDYTHLVILSDLHLPGRNIPLKEKVIETINSWPDVDGVVALGDLCNDLGTVQEYASVKKFFSRLEKPLFPIVGNHDFIYEDHKSFAGKRIKGTPALRGQKLQMFQKTFSLPSLQYTRKEGPDLLIFLSIDDLHSNLLAEISSSTLDWLRAQLKIHAQKPTIIFCHTPLKGTLMSRNRSAENEHFIAQPHEEIRKIILQNPQIFLWVSGHTHIAPTNPRFSDPVNVFERQVTNIHNCDMDGRSYLSDADEGTATHNEIWTNSLFLYPDRVAVKTYDHGKREWITRLQREIRPFKTPSPPVSRKIETSFVIPASAGVTP
jgi:3',5'-cyclic-AMP phosphodiesterase